MSKTLYKPENLRMNGSCPLTPDEMGLLLSGLGFSNHTPVYMASKVRRDECRISQRTCLSILIILLLNVQ